MVFATINTESLFETATMQRCFHVTGETMGEQDEMARYFCLPIAPTIPDAIAAGSGSGG